MKDLEKKILESNLSNREKLSGGGIIVVNGGFNETMMEDVYFKLNTMVGDNNISKITIYINSNGGYVDALNPLVDLFDFASTMKPVQTIVLGKAYSCGAMLLIAGTHGYRIAHKSSRILIHEVSSSTTGSVTQMEEDVKETRRLNETLKTMLKDRTKMTKKEIEKYMDSNIDMFLTAKQALKFGIIDKIL